MDRIPFFAPDLPFPLRHHHGPVFRNRWRRRVRTVWLAIDGADAVGRHWAYNSMNSEPNKPAAGNAGIASQLTIGHHWPGVAALGVRRFKHMIEDQYAE